MVSVSFARLFRFLLWVLACVYTEGNFRIDRHCKSLKYELDRASSSQVQHETSTFLAYLWLREWNPTWSCPLEEKMQKVALNEPKGDGSKWICDVPVIAQKKKCIVYSFGSHGDFSFEEEILDRLGCEIHVFDFSSYTPDTKDERLVFHRWGIADHDKVVTMNDEPVEFKSLPSIVRALGHENTVIDILKLDVEGCEFGILDDVLMWQQLEALGTRFDQLQLEVHSIGVNRDTYQWIFPILVFSDEQIDFLFRVLHQQGYAMFHKEVNALTGVSGEFNACEFAFVKLDIDCITGTAKGDSPFLDYIK